MEVFQISLDMVLGNLFWVALLDMESWTRWHPEAISNLNNSMITWIRFKDFQQKEWFSLCNCAVPCSTVHTETSKTKGQTLIYLNCGTKTDLNMKKLYLSGIYILWMYSLRENCLFPGSLMKNTVGLTQLSKAEWRIQEILFLRKLHIFRGRLMTWSLRHFGAQRALKQKLRFLQSVIHFTIKHRYRSHSFTWLTIFSRQVKSYAFHCSVLMKASCELLYMLCVYPKTFDPLAWPDTIILPLALNRSSYIFPVFQVISTKSVLTLCVYLQPSVSLKSVAKKIMSKLNKKGRDWGLLYEPLVWC